MTLKEKYSHLFTDLNAFGRHIPAIPETIEALISYATRCFASDIPILHGTGKRMMQDIARCNNDLNTDNL